MKNFKKWITSKGGLTAILVTLGLVVVATIFLVVGFVYADLNGDWSRIGELLLSDGAIFAYVTIGVLLFIAFYIYILIKRNEDIK